MKAEKKLVRGLADLSPLFQRIVPRVEKHPAVSVQTPALANASAAGSSLDRWVCLTPMISDPEFDIADEIALAKILSHDFEKAYVISVSPSFERYQAYAGFFNIPCWEKTVISGSAYAAPESDGLIFSFLPESRFKTVASLKPSNGKMSANQPGPVLAFLDGGFMSSAGLMGDAAHLLDFGILVFQPSISGITKAYRFIRSSFSLNRKLRYLALVVGEGAEQNCEFIYEHFNDIVSRFVGCDLNLLGWAEGGRSRIEFGRILEHDERDFSQAGMKYELKKELSGAAL